MDGDQILWSGHVSIIKQADGKARVDYQRDGAEELQSYFPHGFLEEKAVHGIVEHLGGQ